ncbi:hypothetical protein BH23BAC3_BH23BAC3_05080 [soil metagenome]
MIISKLIKTLFISFLLIVAFVVAPETSDAQLQPGQIDTLYHAQVAPGMYHTEYDIRSVPWRLQVLRIDQNEQDVEFRTVKANNRLAGLQTPMEMKAELENDSVYVVGGINGDFYSTGGVPVNAQVVDGTLLKRPFNRELIAFDRQFQPFIQTTSFSGSVVYNGGEININGVNESRGENHLTVYNSFMGNSTGTNTYGSEAGIRLVDDWIVNGSMKAVVEEIYPDQGGTEIGNYDMILSGHGTSSDFVQSLSEGDTLEVALHLNPLDRPILEAMGGSTQFVKNGQVNSNWEERHPRTAVGFSADTSNVYFVVVDGRQTRSAGMMLSELGDFMVEIGVDHAINLDGGGSTAMVVQNDVVNNPSDGGLQRSVANALFVTMENPGFGDTQGIQIRPGYQKLFLGRHVDVMVHHYDENFRRELIPLDDVDFTIDSDLGSINSNGRFTAGYDAKSGYLFVETDGFRDSLRIEVMGVDRLTLSPKEVSIDTTMDFTPAVSISDSDGLHQTLSRDRIEWSLTDEWVGEVDEEGTFTPLSTGSTGIIATVGEVSDTAWVKVSQLEGFTELTRFSNLGDWEITTENLDPERVEIESLGEQGIELRFSYPSQSDRSHIFVNRSIPIEGVPKFANIETSGDGEDYIVFVDIETLDEGRYRMVPQRHANHMNPEVLEFIFEEQWTTRLTSGTTFNFPFTFESVSVQLPANSTGEDKEGVFRFHNAGVIYSETSVSAEPEESEISNRVKLNQNYPNPFNPATTIQFSLPERMNVTLEIFDLLGRLVATPIDHQLSGGTHQVEWDASNLASSVYFYRLTAGNQVENRSMILAK